MRIKSFSLFIFLIVALLNLKAGVSANGFSEVRLTTPEETLNTYIDALREGNLYKVLRCYYSERSDFKFYLPGPIKIEKYVIVKKRIYTKQMADRYKAIPVAKIGDVELDVNEYIEGREEMFTYIFRQINQEWRMISHSSWDQPD